MDVSQVTVSMILGETKVELLLTAVLLVFLGAMAWWDRLRQGRASTELWTSGSSGGASGSAITGGAGAQGQDQEPR